MLGISLDKEVNEIDSLLDEVETQFLTQQYKRYNPNKIVVSSLEARQCECTNKTKTDWTEVDDLLKDFKFEDPNPFSKNKNKPWNRQPIQKLKEYEHEHEHDDDDHEDQISYNNKNDKNNKQDLKCFPVYLAGSTEPMGYSQAGFEKACDKLKCIKCDFDVEYYDNYSWDTSVDYLFLRNNIPDFEKVSCKLQRIHGIKAYACQCQHASIGKLTNIKSLPQFRWVCGKH